MQNRRRGWRPGRRVSRKATTAKKRMRPGIAAPELRACVISGRSRKTLQARRTLLIGADAFDVGEITERAVLATVSICCTLATTCAGYSRKYGV